MKIPLNWLENYITLKHTPEEFGDIMTKLEFLQDGPVDEINGQPVINLEVRQNRPDMLSIIGAAREYAAYIDRQVIYPQQWNKEEKEWNPPSQNLSVHAKDIVKRFCAVEIKGVKIEKSPKWMKDALEAYGVQSINNIVDITNYVMLEYGIPLHAFDTRKLRKSEGCPLLTLRRAKEGEMFRTWLDTKIELTKEDLVVADAERPVAIAGVIGGANSDIDNKTKNIILEGATYDHANIRRASLRHIIRTDASTRHEKILNPEMVETAIRRALYLIKELAGGEIIKIEDFYENKQEPIIIDFNTFEITRLGGVQLEIEMVTSLLNRLGFNVIEQKRAIGIEKNVLVVRVPSWRTDVNLEADLVEEVLRLWGYDNIPVQAISAAPPDYSTPVSIQLEEKIRNTLVNLGLDEHITNPLVKYRENDKDQIQLENPLNKEKDGLRTTLCETLLPVVENSHKSGQDKVAIFEIGKIYKQRKIGEYVEEKRVETLYSSYSFEKVKGDFTAVLSNLGLCNVKWKDTNGVLEYSQDRKIIATLRSNGYQLLTDNIVKVVDITTIPCTKIQTQLVQRIAEEIALVMDEKQPLGEISSAIETSSNYITSVELVDIYKGAQIANNKKSVTFKVIFNDPKNRLTRRTIEKIKKQLLHTLEKKHKILLRK